MPTQTQRSMAQPRSAQFRSACAVWLVVPLVVCCGSWLETRAAEPLRIPAFTAYTSPNAHAARVREPEGITRWSDPTQCVQWFGLLKKSGEIRACVVIEAKGDALPPLVLTVAGEEHIGSLKGTQEGLSTLDFGTFAISETGHTCFELRLSPNAAPTPFRVVELLLEGSATEEAHFNLKERRNAASVHLSYDFERQAEIEAFYTEVTAVDEPTGTFYMACGWHRGYFGMQINSPQERRIIFSVWDSGDEANDRGKVASENRVQLVDKGQNVFSGDFGNEGTGGHSHLKFLWKTGSKQRFLVVATPKDATHTVFAGYWFHPIDQRWMLISAWNAPKEGGRLRGLHSFSENFIGESGHLRRKALYGNGWYRTADGVWHEITTARFSHDPTGKSDRLDRFMGIETNEFFLSHGGFAPGFTTFGTPFTREPNGQPPSDLELPELPQ
jgi:hypothetical protein